MGTLNATSIAALLKLVGVSPNEPMVFTPIPASVKTRAEAMHILGRAVTEIKDAAQKLLDDGVLDEHEAASFRRILTEPDIIKRIQRLKLWLARVLEFQNERQANPSHRRMK